MPPVERGRSLSSNRQINFTGKLTFPEVSWSTAHSPKSRYPKGVRGLCHPLARALQQFVNGNVTNMYACHKLYLGRERLPK
jgi:hypothetical protein